MKTVIESNRYEVALDEATLDHLAHVFYNMLKKQRYEKQKKTEEQVSTDSLQS